MSIFLRFLIGAFLLLRIPLATAVQPPPAASPLERPGKHVVIDKSTQTLSAYDGRQLVFQSRVSTGKEGKRTPNGAFTVGEKQRMHHSALYNNAPMPFSVQVSRNYFIHGFKSVPEHPASHGCIRLPLEEDGQKPAEQFYNWVEPGTPIDIVGRWGAD